MPKPIPHPSRHFWLHEASEDEEDDDNRSLPEKEEEDEEEPVEPVQDEPEVREEPV